MNFPEKVTFKLIDKKNNKPIANIATLLILYAHRKNNYSVGIKLSDKNGFVTFTRSECIEEIKKFQEAYIMDYFSNLQECLPKVSLQILSNDQINYIVKRRRKPSYTFKDYWQSDKKFLKSLELSDNYKYVNELYDFPEGQLQEGKYITVELERNTSITTLG